MKKYVCLILLGVLLCLAMTAQAAALPDEYMFPFDMAQTQAGIYYLCQDDLGQMRLYLYKGQELMAVGDLLPESEPEGVTGLISADKLLGYNARSGKVFQLTPEANGISVSQVAQLDLSTLSPEGEGSVFIQSVALCGKTLYLTYYSCDQNATAAWLAAFDMTTGQGKQLPLCGPICAAPYSNERLLVIASPAQSQAPEGYYLPQQPELMAYDPQTGAFTALAALEGYAFSGLGYDGATDTIYYLQEGKIMALQGHGPAREAACAPFESSYYANAQGFICQGLYYNFDEGGPYWRQVDSAQAVAEPLKVYGLAYDKGAQRFTRENPQTPLESISPWWTLSEIKMALASGLPTIDALLVDHVSTLNALVDQELAADLSQHPGVRAFVESCSPQVQAQVMRDGKIYALPLEINGSCLAYDAQVLKAMGLTENDLPRTYEELFAFLTRWNRQWAEEPYLPMDPWGLRSSVFYAMLNAYEDAYTLAGKELTFDTALFRRLTKGLKDMDLSNIEISDWENAALMEALQEKASLFADYSLTDAISQPDLVPWPLALEGSAPAPIGTELRLLVIPAKTTQPLAAAQLLNCYLAAMEPAAQALLSPNAAQPLEDPRYEESLTFWQAQLVRLKARQAEGALDLSSQIAPLEDRLNRPEAYRYILSPQSLALCQERILPHLYLRREISILNASYDDATGFTDLEQKFLLGEISPSQFVKDMERKLRMARLALK